MCGIVAYKGHKNCHPILLNGLKRLEYRGYDSAGIACINSNDKFVVSVMANTSNASFGKLPYQLINIFKN